MSRGWLWDSFTLNQRYAVCHGLATTPGPGRATLYGECSWRKKRPPPTPPRLPPRSPSSPPPSPPAAPPLGRPLRSCSRCRRHRCRPPVDVGAKLRQLLQPLMRSHRTRRCVTCWPRWAPCKNCNRYRYLIGSNLIIIYLNSRSRHAKGSYNPISILTYSLNFLRELGVDWVSSLWLYLSQASVAESLSLTTLGLHVAVVQPPCSVCRQ